MKNSFLLLIGIAVCGLILNSCDPAGPNPSNNTIEVNNNITTPTVWTGDKVYVITKSDFYVESNLIIEAGAVIKFQTTARYLTISGEGKIIANGTALKPIVFTSYLDDNNGGDSNGDGGTTIPTKGDWGNIDLNGTLNSEFLYCKFLYGGFGTKASPTIELEGESSAKIDNCTFAYNGGGKNGNYYIGALNAGNAKNTTSITNTIFYNNILPLTINAEINIDNSNSFSYGENSNTYNAIFVSKDIQRNTTWQETEVAFVATSENMQVTSGKILTLGDGVVIKFMENGTLTLISGEPSLVNFNGADIFYTSYKDDLLKGDSNGDGSLTSPGSADWTGVFLDNFKGTGYATWPNIKYNDPNASVK